MKGIKIGEEKYLLGDFSQEDLEGLIESLEADGVPYEVIPSDPAPKPKQETPSTPIGYTGDGRERRGPRPTADQLRRTEKAAAEKAHAAHEENLARQAELEDLPKWAVRLRHSMDAMCSWHTMRVTMYGDTEVLWFEPSGRMYSSDRRAGNTDIAKRVIAGNPAVQVKEKPARP